ncbi:uncharacterized protein [Blastocystis hominis]|uniref:Uncharacterized protein n=1 Tax=Blastocystis hominis TaxID=12968 RepID=D8LVK5_BLAHO|nr:uncharacterized protein [Blastocystis hominis]CBK19844.2 unnamed protein product [Blastocystis hominis]|eukprot:XP_012893892.1 uncharacterized protein [Blastocystis hominis]
MEIIQKQIEELKIKMEKIHSEMERKNEEIEKTKREAYEKGMTFENDSESMPQDEDAVD